MTGVCVDGAPVPGRSAIASPIRHCSRDSEKHSNGKQGKQRPQGVEEQGKKAKCELVRHASVSDQHDETPQRDGEEPVEIQQGNEQKGEPCPFGRNVLSGYGPDEQSDGEQRFFGVPKDKECENNRGWKVFHFSKTGGDEKENGEDPHKGDEDHPSPDGICASGGKVQVTAQTDGPKQDGEGLEDFSLTGEVRDLCKEKKEEQVARSNEHGQRFVVGKPCLEEKLDGKNDGEDGKRPFPFQTGEGNGDAKKNGCLPSGKRWQRCVDATYHQRKD
jgi:hypothetical protein